MASRKAYLELARVLGDLYQGHLAPRISDDQWGQRTFSVEDILALPGVREAVAGPAQLGHMLQVISEFAPRVWFSGFAGAGDASARVTAFNPPPYWVPGCHFRLYPPGDYRPSLLVETHVEISEAEILSAKAHMASIGSQFGLLFDVSRTVVLRDSLETDDPLSSTQVAHELPTSEVLARFATVTRASLDKDVETWLQRLTTSWMEAIPRQSNREVLIGLLEDVAPAALGAEIQQRPLAA